MNLPKFQCWLVEILGFGARHSNLKFQAPRIKLYCIIDGLVHVGYTTVQAEVKISEKQTVAVSHLVITT